MSPSLNHLLQIITPSGWFADLIVNIAASMLIACAVLLFARWKAKAPYRGMFQLPSGRQFYVIAAGMRPEDFQLSAPSPRTDENQDSFYGTGYGELIALHNLTQVLTSVGLDINKVISGIDLGCGHYYDRRRLDGDLILLGGGTFNEVVRKIWSLVQHRVRLDIHDDLTSIPDGAFWIEDKTDGTLYRSLNSNDIKVGSLDWGLITFIKNPLDERHRVIIVDGLHSYGLIGASKLLLYREIKKYARQLRAARQGEFQILVKCRIEPPEVFLLEAAFFSLSSQAPGTDLRQTIAMRPKA